MKYIILLLSVASLYANSCYTVQIKSAYNDAKNYDKFMSKTYPQSCKAMEIGKTLAVRCGCFDAYSDAKKTLPYFKKIYKKSYIMSTYKSRFDTPTLQKVEVKEEKVKKTLVEVSTVAPAILAPMVLERKEPEIVKVLAPIVKEDEYIQSADLEEGQVIIDDAKNDLPVVQEEKLQLIKSKKKKKKIKYRKKRAGEYFYTRSLKQLQNKRGVGRYDYKYKFGAQLSYDAGYIYEADDKYFNSLWRRVRVYHSGSFFDETLFYQLEYSFTGSNKYKDIYAGYQNKIQTTNSEYRIKLGNIKIPFSLERYSSSKNLTFMERALNDAFSENRKLAGEVLLSQNFYNNRINLFASAFSNSIDDNINDELNKPGQSYRAVYSYKARKRHLLSFGGGYQTRDMKGENVKINQASESKLIENKYVSVKIKDVDTLNKYNIEALYIYNKFSLQAEYTSTDVLALVDNYNFDAYYGQVSYFLFGKGRRFSTDDSKLKKVKPNKDGALEFAFRYSYINLNDKGEKGVNPEDGGEQKDYTYSLNYYMSKELRFMLNYIVAEPIKTDDYDGRLQIVQGRVLFAF